MTYDEWIAAVSNLLVIDPTDADFLAISTRAIEYGEQRMYRELDLLYTYTTSDAGAYTIGNRNFTLPADTIVVNSINNITPTATAPDSGVRNPMTPVSREWLDAVYGNSATNLRSLPLHFAMLTNTTIAVGPWPDAAYHVEVARETRPTPLSSTTTTTILTLYIPDCFLTCTMIDWSGFQRNFGAGTDAPQDAVGWEKMYGEQMASATVEAFRQKQLGTSATGKSTSPALNTQRG